MEIEQLKLILNALAQMGESGKDAFIWWLLLDKIPSFIIWVLFLSTVCFGIGKVYKSSIESSHAHQDLRNIATLLGVSITDEYRFYYVPKIENEILLLRKAANENTST